VKRTRLVLVVAALAALLAACSPSEHRATATVANTTAFPVTLTAANGPISIPHRPTRIVSLSASATTMLYAIGAGHQVTAVDKYSTYPAHTPLTTLTGFETDPEIYVPYRPDLLILAQDETGKLASQLAELGIPTLILPPANGVEDTYRQISLLGRATGHLGAATNENASIRRHLAAIVRSVGRRARGLTYYQEVDPTLYTATSKTFIGGLYKSLGMVDIADGAISKGNEYPQLSAEALVAASPDYVFLADATCCGQSPRSFDSRSGYATIRAIKDHHVFVVPEAIASEWGPRIVQFLQIIANDVTGGTSRPT
jgi:iron complex transport system substrate-binding protein